MSAILYSFRRCPYAMRARMVLKYSGFEAEILEVSLKDKPQEMLKISPKGTVPVLQLEDGTVLDQSRDIMIFALQHNDPNNWLIEGAEDLIDENDNYFKNCLDKYKYHIRHPEKTQMDYRSKGEEFLKKLEIKLNQHYYLFGNKISYADIAIFPFVRQFAHVDRDWFYNNSYKKLQKWLDGFLESELFNNVMRKNDN